MSLLSYYNIPIKISIFNTVKPTKLPALPCISKIVKYIVTNVIVDAFLIFTSTTPYDQTFNTKVNSQGSWLLWAVPQVIIMEDNPIMMVQKRRKKQQEHMSMEPDIGTAHTDRRSDGLSKITDDTNTLTWQPFQVRQTLGTLYTAMLHEILTLHGRNIRYIYI